LNFIQIKSKCGKILVKYHTVFSIFGKNGEGKREDGWIRRKLHDDHSTQDDVTTEMRMKE